MNDQRPNPDALLTRVQAEETQQARGKLKIFFGAMAGVGKTYAMLEAAQARRADVDRDGMTAPCPPPGVTCLQSTLAVPILRAGAQGRARGGMHNAQSLSRHGSLSGKAQCLA